MDIEINQDNEEVSSSDSILTQTKDLEVGDIEKNPTEEIKTFMSSKTHFNGIEISKLTKNQLKKYHKCQTWAEKKARKRAAEREKSKEKKKFAKMNNIDLGPSRKELKRKKMANSSCRVGVCIDLSFDHLMIDKDMAKTIKQILRVYTENRRAKAPLQLHLSSFNGRSKEEMSRHHGYENWDIQFHELHYLDVFSKEKLVYLTSESDNIIEQLENDKVYIIGGLVDHNQHKGLCFNQAVKEGIAHGQLPIGEYFRLKHRKVLTINQVFEILVRVTEGESFKDALEDVLPKRIPKISVNKPKEEGKKIENIKENNEIVVENNVVSEKISKSNVEMELSFSEDTKRQDQHSAGNQEELENNDVFESDLIDNKVDFQEDMVTKKEPYVGESASQKQDSGCTVDVDFRESGEINKRS